MANTNDVTLGTLNTSNISSENILINGEPLDAYVRRHSTGTKVTVDPQISEGTLIAKISCDETVSEIYAPKAEREYTAFEVFPTSVLIPAGTADTNERDQVSSVANLFGFDNTTATGLIYKEEVPASGLEVKIDCYLGKDGLRDSIKDEVMIDWGDGSEKQTYRQCQDASGYAVHTYPSSKKYVLKIYGPIASFKMKETNCVSRVWDTDLPLASTLWNIADICKNSKCILRVKVPGYNFKFPAVVNFTNAFQYATNLQEFIMGNGKGFPLPRVTMMSKFFSGCKNLRTVEWDPEGYGRFPMSEDGSWEYMYNYCSSLTTPIEKLLPINSDDAKGKFGWCSSDTIRVVSMFNDCKSIPAITDQKVKNRLGKLLWNSDRYTYATYSNYGSMFRGCTNLSADIPSNWGGSAAAVPQKWEDWE